MVLIVSPELTLHVVADVDAVDALVDRLGLDKKTSKELKGNLKQLAGFNDVGADRVGRGRAGNWQKLEDVVWLQRGGCSVAFPVVGKLDHRIKLITQHDPRVNPGSLKNVLNGSKPRAGEWRRLDSMPRAVHALEDGASLIGITTASAASATTTTTQPVFPDYGCSLAPSVAQIEAAWAAAMPRASRELRDAAAGACGEALTSLAATRPSLSRGPRAPIG